MTFSVSRPKLFRDPSETCYFLITVEWSFCNFFSNENLNSVSIKIDITRTLHGSAIQFRVAAFFHVWNFVKTIIILIDLLYISAQMHICLPCTRYIYCCSLTIMYFIQFSTLSIFNDFLLYVCCLHTINIVFW